MLNITIDEINNILKDFSINYDTKSFTELQRDNYDEYGPNTDRVRLIIKVEFYNHTPVVIRFRNEENMTTELIEAQSNFAELLRKNGIETPTIYTVDKRFSKRYIIDKYDVIVTVEQFVDNEISCVDTAIAESTGELLARMHNISEKNNCHVFANVLFDPMTKMNFSALRNSEFMKTNLLKQNLIYTKVSLISIMNI